MNCRGVWGRRQSKWIEAFQKTTRREQNEMDEGQMIARVRANRPNALQLAAILLLMSSTAAFGLAGNTPGVH